MLQAKAETYYRLLTCALIVAAFLFVCRYVIQYEAVSRYLPASPLQVLLSAGRRFGMDALAVSAVTACALGAATLWRRLGWAVLFAGAAALMLTAAVNARIVDLYEQPATVTLIEFAKLLDLRSVPTLAGYMNTTDLALLGAAVALFVLLLAVPWLVRPGLVELRWFKRTVLALAGVAFLAAPLLALQPGDEIHRRHANAAWWLAKSYVTSFGREIPEVPPPSSTDDFGTYPVEPLREAGPSGIRNVVLIVLESVGSQYVDPVGRPELTPRIAGLMPGAAYFPNTYVPMPGSWTSLFSLTTSLYPPVSESFPEGERLRSIPNLLDEMRAHGLRGGAFLSSNWEYSEMGEFFRDRGLVHVAMARNAERCALPEIDIGTLAPAARLPGGSDECSFTAMEDWIARSDEPFFALLWTNQTHYPYRVGRSRKVSGTPAENLQRYRAAIRETDRLVGRLVERLEAQGRLDDTLLVLVGDHGEAFGQHGNQVHGADVFDETVRVPLMLVNPRLFSGTVSREPVRLIDVAPTILALVGRERPGTFQGFDLTGPVRASRVFFSAPWLDISLGYVSGNRKYIWLYEPDDLMAFDLAANPLEDLGRRLALSTDEQQRVKWELMHWRGQADAFYTRGPGK